MECKHKFTYKKVKVPDKYIPYSGIFSKFRGNILEKGAHTRFDLFKYAELVMTKEEKKTETCYECCGAHGDINCNDCPDHWFIREAYRKMGGPDEPE